MNRLANRLSLVWSAWAGIERSFTWSRRRFPCTVTSPRFTLQTAAKRKSSIRLWEYPSPSVLELLRLSKQFGKLFATFVIVSFSVSVMFSCLFSFPANLLPVPNSLSVVQRESKKNQKGQTKWEWSQIRSFFADFGRFSLFLRITAIRRCRFSQKTTDSRRKPQETAEFCRNPVVFSLSL